MTSKFKSRISIQVFHQMDEEIEQTSISSKSYFSSSLCGPPRSQRLNLILFSLPKDQEFEPELLGTRNSSANAKNRSVQLLKAKNGQLLCQNSRFFVERPVGGN